MLCCISHWNAAGTIIDLNCLKRCCCPVADRASETRMSSEALRIGRMTASVWKEGTVQSLFIVQCFGPENEHNHSCQEMSSVYSFTHSTVSSWFLTRRIQLRQVSTGILETVLTRTDVTDATAACVTLSMCDRIYQDTLTRYGSILAFLSSWFMTQKNRAAA